MRVLHVLPYQGVGGTEIAVRRIIDAVRPFGIEGRALLLAPTTELTRYLDEAGIPYDIPDHRPEPSLRGGLRFLVESRRFARRWLQTDVIHCADAQAAYYVATAGRLAGVPVICHVRNRLATMPWRDSVFINRASHFVFVSDSTWRQFGLHVPRRRGSVLYDASAVAEDAVLAGRDTVARAVRAELGLPANARIASMFARVNPQKDYPTLVAAAARLRASHPALRFVVVGDHSNVAMNREHHREVAASIAAAGLADRFIFTGFRSDAQRLMLASDLCVLSTHFEGLPLVVLEAMGLARPCVATAVDGVLEALDHDRTGLVHRHGDAAELATCIARLLDDSELAARLGQAAREEVRRRFGADRFAADLRALYRGLLRSDAAPAEPGVGIGPTTVRQE
ncbi:glycosyltransferase family 4 protein [Roseomonas terrae]|jgi:glycosyltransferase involved in cell wall biosynthesis|uniref:Glycosyltransferase family 4 protein n=1 Tax=Neoroseomonas terrae TaxID=424799 RepID=A0ABS5EJ21_9PROT|nr:glycosyltransferase family 4 protein [Neoroseomonas terrae]MBR0651033.1 glycosyltransferase family 4 protein [Neoroseomonas terrae]